MKRKLTALLLVLLLAVTLAVPALAAGDWVTDEAGLLTDQQISQLSQRAAALAHSSGVGVYIRTVDDYADYGFTDVETASYTLYHNDSLGVGDGRDGVLLLLSVSNRKYAAFVYGDKAELLFPDSALQQLEDGFLDDFRNDDWYGGFCDYIDGCAGLLSGESYTGSDSDYAYSPGHDADVDPGFSAPSLLRNLGIALVISREKSAVAVAQKGADLPERHIQRAQVADGVEHLKLPRPVVAVAGRGVGVFRRKQADGLIVAQAAHAQVKQLRHVADGKQLLCPRHVSPPPARAGRAGAARETRSRR